MQPMSEISENIAEGSPETFKTKSKQVVTGEELEDKLIDASLAMHTSNRPPLKRKYPSDLENGGIVSV